MRSSWRNRRFVVVLVALVVGGLVGTTNASAASVSTGVPAPSTSVEKKGSGILSSVSVTQGPHSTISAVVVAKTTSNAIVSVAVSGGKHPPVNPPTSKTGTTHTVAVVGLRAETTYTLTIKARKANRPDASTSLGWTTGALPDDLPAPTLTKADPSAMAAGVTIFDALPRSAPTPGAAVETHNGFALAVDDTGTVIWYYEAGPLIVDISQTSHGTLLLTLDDLVIREIDVLGNTLREFAGTLAVGQGTDAQGHALTTADTKPIAIPNSHHELYELPNGDLLTLTSVLVQLTEADAEALCPNNPQTAIISDDVVELSPNGNVVQKWPLTDVFNPVQRPGTEMCVQALAGVAVFPSAPLARDWTHTNAVVLDAKHNRLLVSVRHLDAVIAIRYHADADGPAGQLLWELGPHGTLTMTGDGAWQYHEHAIELHANDTILLYDNGNHRPGTSADGGPGVKPYSRAVLYKINEKKHTVTQLWEHRDQTSDGTPVFTQYLGDADRLANGDVLITHGGGVQPDGTAYGRIVEVHPGRDPHGRDDTIVFDLTLGTPGHGFNIYRSTRLPSLYGIGKTFNS